MKGVIYIGGAFIGLAVVAWAWPLITAVALGGGAGVLGAVVVFAVEQGGDFPCRSSPARFV